MSDEYMFRVFHDTHITSGTDFTQPKQAPEMHSNAYFFNADEAKR